MNLHRFLIAARLGGLLSLGGWAAGAETMPCRIEVVEKGSAWPVPLVELRTTSRVRLVSDNAGLIAFDLPELMGRETWFEVIGHGYEVAKDGLGNRGVRLKPHPGERLRVEVTRTVPAERLGRLTGSGLFAEAQKLGERLEWPEAGPVGCDSVQNALYGGKLFWAWGDTLIAKYPLGIYDTTSATTPIQPLKSLQPPVQLPFEYFRDAGGAVRGVAKMPGSGPTWVFGYVALPDRTGASRLLCTYTKISGHLDIYEIGQAMWDDEKAEFGSVRTLWKAADGKPMPKWPGGHPAFSKDAEGREWLYFGNPFPTMRMPPTVEGYFDEKQWEAVEAPKSLMGTNGETVTPHSGSIAWSAWRNCWVSVFLQRGGKPSAFGELWYAEGEAPTGPWGQAVKVVTHENYTFYNPRLHPEFTNPDSPILLFEGTYTEEFANHPEATPRYNYNQILYRLDLDDPALAGARAR